MEIQAGTLVTKRPEAMEASVGSEIVLMSPEAGKVFGLGSTGSDVWRRLQGEVPVSAVLQSLAAEYDAPAERLEADVTRLLTQLHERALIELR